MMYPRPFCDPCRHYVPPPFPPGAIKGEWSVGTCAAFPDGVPALIWAGGFDHRDPHPDDNGIQFEMRTDAQFDWDEEQTNAFLDRNIRAYRQNELRRKAHDAKMKRLRKQEP